MRVPQAERWRERRVLITGDTGFKGSWLALWLRELGADVYGFALPPDTVPSAYEQMGIADLVQHRDGDVRDLAAVTSCLTDCQPEIVLHLAAQPLVRRAHHEPAETFAVNVMGTVNVLEAVRSTPSVRAVLVVTTDKCYAETEAGGPYAEDDALGGVEPYSASKAAAEHVVSAYREAFLRDASVAVASVRAGNVIGGGDWSPERLVPDLVHACATGTAITLRFPGATRPWQHVIDALSAYLVIGEELLEHPDAAARAWNVGPALHDAITVGEFVDRFAHAWGISLQSQFADAPREAPRLTLDASQITRQFGWAPALNVDEAIAWTVDWYRARPEQSVLASLARTQIARLGALTPR